MDIAQQFLAMSGYQQVKVCLYYVVLVLWNCIFEMTSTNFMINKIDKRNTGMETALLWNPPIRNNHYVTTYGEICPMLKS